VITARGAAWRQAAHGIFIRAARLTAILLRL
jgi:hypothetical protein